MPIFKGFNLVQVNNAKRGEGQFVDCPNGVEDFVKYLSVPQPVIGPHVDAAIAMPPGADRDKTLNRIKSRVPLISPARFVDNHPNADGFIEAYAIGFDVDEGNIPLIDKMPSLAFGKSAFWSSTAKSSEFTPRWRLFYFLDRPVNVEEYRHIWALLEVILNDYGVFVGQAAKDPSRKWYVSMALGTDAYFKCGYEEGPALCVADWLSIPAPSAAEVKPLKPVASISDNDKTDYAPTEQDEAIVSALLPVWPPLGKRHEARLQLILALRGFSTMKGFSIDDYVPLNRALWLVSELSRQTGNDTFNVTKHKQLVTSTYERFNVGDVGNHLKDKLAMGAEQAEAFMVQFKGLLARPAKRTADGRRNPHLSCPVRGENGKLKSITGNEIVQHLTMQDEWQGVLSWDVFRELVVANNPPYALDCERGGTMTNSDALKIRSEFASFGFGVHKDELFDYVAEAAKLRPFHPILDWLDSLGTPKTNWLDSGLSKIIFGTQDDLVDIYLRKTLIGAVRRMRRPGTKVDTTLILVGNQAALKTTFITALFGDEWVSTQLSDLASKDASMAMGKVWALELAEIDGIFNNSTDNAKVKEFLTRRFDDYRAPYARLVARHPRASITIGTTNQHQLLNDLTGDRRYWGIDVTGFMNVAWVAKHRSELWAEAVALEQLGEQHWLDKETEERRATANAKFTDTDPWFELVQDYAAKQTGDFTAMSVFIVGVSENAKGPVDYKRTEQLRINGILRKLGYRQFRTTDYKRRWRKE